MATNDTSLESAQKVKKNILANQRYRRGRHAARRAQRRKFTFFAIFFEITGTIDSTYMTKRKVPYYDGSIIKLAYHHQRVQDPNTSEATSFPEFTR